MIIGTLRAAWFVTVGIVIAGVLGLVVLVAALFRVRGTVYSRLSQVWARTTLWVSGCSVETHGADNLKEGEPAIVASNHVSWFDVLALASVLPLPFYFVAKKELELVPIFGQAWQIAGHISIDRGNREKAVRSLRKAGERVRAENGLVVIYPEGTRSRTGRLQPLKKGTFFLAKETGLPIVPVIVTGSFDIMRPDTFTVRPATIHLWFEPPIETAGMTEQDIPAVMERVRGVMARRLAAQEQMPPLGA
jgi:1-acyl-sn-glycerol-3-phosphate acyltransferase